MTMSVLLDGGLMVPVRNRHKNDRLTLVAKNPNVPTLTIQGAARQFGNIFIIQNSAGTALFTANISANTIGIGTSSNVSTLVMSGGNINSVGFIGFGGSSDASIVRKAAANLQFGTGDIATPIAQTLSFQSVVAGTVDTPGVNTTFVGSCSTGAAAGGNFIWNVSPASSTGSTQNAAMTVMTISPATTNVLIQAIAATVTPVVFQGAASQSADLTRWRKSDGSTIYAGMDSLARPYTANTTPTILAGTGAGGSPTVSISGTDVNGVISVTSGTLPTGSAVVATISFSAAYGTTPKTIILTPANANAASLNALTMVWVDSAGIGTGSWTINSGSTGLGASTVYKWYYQVLG